MKTLRLQRDPADPERLRKSLQLAPDFVLDSLWQGFCVPTLGYVDRHTVRVQHVAMIVMLRGKVLRGLRGLHFGHRSRPGDELLANHLLGQLLRRAAVRRDDPAALQSQEDAQSTGKVIGLDGHASSLFRSTKVRKWSGSRRFCNSR